MDQEDIKEVDDRRLSRPLFGDILGLAFWLLLTFMVAAWGAQYNPGTWYQHLAKPDWTPPGWIFGPVWSLLYAAMAVAAWLVWRSAGIRAAALPLGFYLLQLVLNGLWSWIFFGRQMVGLALLDIILLWAMIAVTTVLFWKKNRAAGVLFIPYLLWVTFASALNWKIWMMN
jgi:benzodiazapine receptor